MSETIRFIIVGENIHCTRIFKKEGANIKALADGRYGITYTDKGQERHLPIPSRFLESADWEKGRVKHAAVAVWQGLHGDSAGSQAGAAYLAYMARSQEAAGASYLDLNVDEFSTDPQERVHAMAWTVETIQAVSTAALSIDSSNTEVLKAGLEACEKSKGQPLVNSVSLERAAAIPIAREYGAAVIAGATGEEAMPATREEKVANLDRLMLKLRQAGFQEREIFLDPLVFPVSVNPANGLMTLEAIAELRRKLGPAIHFAPGISNISYGMPNRKLLNQVFARLCMEAGADGGIVDPAQINADILSKLDTGGQAYALARAFLIGEDQFGMAFISAVRAGKI